MHEEMLRRLYAAFNERDVDTVLASMQPDVDWPNAIEDTRLHGHDEVRHYWERQWEQADPQVEPVAFERLPNGHIAVTVHQVVRDLEGEVTVDQEVVHTYAIRDGLVESMEITG